MIKYIAFEDGIAGFKPEAPQNVFTNRYGDCKGMAILTKAMLQEAGFDARLTCIGTNRIPYNYDLPSLAVDNHMICTVFNNNKTYILDATEKYIALGKIGERIQGKEMLIEDGDNYIRKIVPMQNPEENLQLRTESIQIKDNQLIGKGQLEIKGEAKKNILYVSDNSMVEDKNKLFNYLSVSDFSNQDVVNVSNTPEIDRDKELKINYNYILNNKISQFDNELFFEVDRDKTMSDTEIKSDRKSSYYFGRRILNKKNITYTIPKGYKISHIPEKITFNDNNIIINISCQIKGNTLLYTNEIEISNGLIAPAEFTPWNNLVKQMNSFYNDQIILKKI